MIQQLYIQNYALISSLDIQPSANFNIITGETGAGKSILLGAVGLLLGNRADTKVLFNTDKKCVVEALFDIQKHGLASFFEEKDIDYEGVTAIRREITPSGKSRAFVNDTPIQLTILRELGQKLVDIHSQHETLLLAKESFQLKLIDAFVEDKKILASYQKAFRSYAKTEKEYISLCEQAHELKEKLDYNSFLLKELEELSLVEDEQEKLETANKKIESAEHIKTQLSSAYQALSEQEPSLLDSLYDVSNSLGQLTGYADNYVKIKERLDSNIHELKDIAQELSQENETLEYEPEEAEKIKSRLSSIYSLQQKHKVLTVKELITIQKTLAKSVDQSNTIEERLAMLKQEKENKHDDLLVWGEKLSNDRAKVIPNIETSLMQIVSKLGMPNATISIAHEKIKPKSSGLDQLSVLFSANKGVKPADISTVASGGEFSRLMFAIKYILADKTAMPTIIFDEIDTGISGEVSIKMAEMMKEMAKHHQLLCITHLPQVAAKGDKHFFVFKDDASERTSSKIKALSLEDRIQHLAEMIGGSNASAHAFESARELLK